MKQRNFTLIFHIVLLYFLNLFPFCLSHFKVFIDF